MAAIQNIQRVARGIELRPATMYALSGAISKSVSFLLLLYFACTLSTGDFGRLAIFNAAILFLMPVVSMGITQSVSNAYFNSDKKSFSHFFSATLMVPAVATLLCMLLLFIFSKQMQEHYAFPAVLVAMIPLAVFFKCINSHMLAMVRNSGNAAKHLFISIGIALAEITLAGFFTGVMEWGWEGGAAALFISCMMPALYALFYFKEEGFMANSFSKKIMLAEYNRNMPLVIMQCALFCMVPAAIFFIEYFTKDIAEAGVFGIAALLSSVIVVLCTIVMRYVYPKMQTHLRQNKINYAALKWYAFFYAGAMLLGTGAAIIAVPLVYNIALGASCHDGLYYYAFICLAYFFCSISYFLYACLLHNTQRQKALFVSISAICISIASHSLFASYWGAYGAAASVCIVSFTVMVIIMLLAKKQLSLILFLKPPKAV